MSSASRPQLSHHHSASFTYGTSETQAQFSSGISQERSTVSPTQPATSNLTQLYNWPPKVNTVPPSLQSGSISSPSAYVQIQPLPQSTSSNMQSSHYSPTQTLPQVQPHFGQSSTTTSSIPNVMLPPLRVPNHNDPRINPPYTSSVPPPLSGGGGNNHYGYSYSTINQYSPYQRPNFYSTGSGHITHNSTSSSNGSELWTPLSANSNNSYSFISNNGNSNANTPTFGAQPPPPSQPNTPNTIQPSIFPNWQQSSNNTSSTSSTSDLRLRLNGVINNDNQSQGTISPLGILNSSNSNSIEHPSRLSLNLNERRSSTPSSQTQTVIIENSNNSNERWDNTKSNLNDGLSPNSSTDRLSDEDDVKPDLLKSIDEGNNGITYTTDCEVKQTAELKRMCYNCTNKSPPSWRKSLLHPGKILCNKCGIFERTHHKPRPPQNDDQKLRKQTPAPGTITATNYRREIPPQLQIMRDDSDGSPVPLSPYSNVPSQATPVSATFTFPQTYYSPSEGFLASHRRMIGSGPGTWNQTSPSQHSLLNTPSSQSSTTLVESGGENSSSSPIRGGHHSYGNGYGHGYGSSPYAHAYAARRNYSNPVRISPIMPSSAGPTMTSQTILNNQYQLNNGFNSNGNVNGNGNGNGSYTPGWMNTRRHSDIQLLPSLSSSINTSLTSNSNTATNTNFGHDDGYSPNSNVNPQIYNKESPNRGNDQDDQSNNDNNGDGVKSEST